jgi:hypothetical protein
MPGSLSSLRFPLCALVVILTGCGAQAGTAPRIERTFDVGWHERASQVAISYAASRIAFHEGRWSAEVTVANHTGKPLYEVTWSLGDNHRTWNGPALVYSGLDVLGTRRLIYVAADHEVPKIPYPLRAGATWHGTVGGPLYETPVLPHKQSIWLRYPVFWLGAPFGGATGQSVQWISLKAIEL